MKSKITFIFFYLILSVITLNLKKKNENKKTLNIITSFLQNHKKESYDCHADDYIIKAGQSCDGDYRCISKKCINGKCAEGLLKLGESCHCDIQCETGHCSFKFWLFLPFNHCTED